MKKVYETTGIPIKSWCDELEDKAFEQANNLAHHPKIVQHISLMPDCLSIDTEILTNKGFELIKNITEQTKIANYNPNTEKIFFSNPKQIIDRPLKSSEKMYEFISTFFDKSILCTENHRIPYKNNMGIIAKNILNNTVLSDYKWGCFGIEKQKEINIKYELLCLIAWVVADGNIKKNMKRKDGTHSYNIRFGLTKERKIKRIKLLLDALKYKYHTHTSNKQTTISIGVEYSKEIIKYVGIKKEYPFLFIEELSHEQAIIFLEEAIKCDGDWENYNKSKTIRYNSTRKKDINFLSALISIHMGVANSNSRWSDGFDKKTKTYYLSVITNNNIELSKNGIGNSHIIKKEYNNYNKNVVCVTCDSGFFVARRNGFTFITGNCHMGYGMPIGGVIAVKDAIIPNAVGVDIGCGMIAVQTSLQEIREDEIKKIIGQLRPLIPTGFTWHKRDQKWDGFDDVPNIELLKKQISKAKKQLGTLGGGNHFAELQKGDDGYIWLMIHSGSRNLGKKTADHFHNIALSLCEKWSSNLPDKDLAFLPNCDKHFDEYYDAMNFCLKFAQENRNRMMGHFNDVVMDVTGGHAVQEINIHHNFAKMENHFGKDVMIHRKGATQAYEDQLGIIPGSMGTNSYIVKGKGNIHSFKSCSHGAGRIMGRMQFNRTHTEEECNKAIEGVVFGRWSKDRKGNLDLSEAPQAYKDIDVVIANEDDLVDVVVKLKPLGCMKG